MFLFFAGVSVSMPPRRAIPPWRQRIRDEGAKRLRALRAVNAPRETVKKELTRIKKQEALRLQEPFHTELRKTAEEGLKGLRAKNATPEEIDNYLGTVKRLLNSSRIQSPWRRSFRDGAAERLRALRKANAPPKAIKEELATIKEQDAILARAEKAMVNAENAEVLSFIEAQKQKLAGAQERKAQK